MCLHRHVFMRLCKAGCLVVLRQPDTGQYQNWWLVPRLQSGKAEQVGRSSSKCKLKQRKVQGEIDLNIILCWIWRLLDRARTDEQRTHDKGQFEVKCQMSWANHAFKSDSLRKIVCHRREKFCRDTEKKHQRSPVTRNIIGLISQ